MNHNGFMPHGYCLHWDLPLIVIFVLTDGLVALSYYSIPAALFLLAFKRRQSVPLQPLLILFGLFIAFCGGGHAIDILSLWKPVYWLKGIWNIGTAGTSAITAIVLFPKVLEFVRMPETAARLEKEKNELREEQTLLRAVLDSTLEGIVLADREGRTLLHNAAASRILGARRGETPQVVWPGHKSVDADAARLPNGRIAERFTRDVPRHGRLYVLRDITERRASEEQRLRLERIVQTMMQGFAVVSASGGAILSTNPSFDEMYGCGAGEPIGAKFESLLDGSPEEARVAAKEITAHAIEAGHWDGEINCRRKDGSGFIAHARINLHDDGETRLLSVIQVDVTGQKRLEEETKRFQTKMLETAKLESVGVLAGGIAHDFNNILTGILGSASLVCDQLSPSSPLLPRVYDVVKATERAADLTRQLLAYAGKGRFLIEAVELNSLVREIANLVRLTIPKNVEVSVQLSKDLRIEADRGQLHQLLMNLIINGAEAIGDEKPGRVTATTARERLDRESIRELFDAEPVEPGEYAVIEVRDDGSGMTRETMSHIFEPFFTTKFTGRGLGLAAALGIVRGHQGGLNVSSEPGLGTTFRVYLPIAGTEVHESPRPKRAAPDLAGTGTVLVVDDEETVRHTARNTLEFYGYRVLEADNGKRGVEMFEQNRDRIDLVLLDLTMPVMSGEEALWRIREIDGSVPVVLSSGFNESEALRRFGTASLAGFLQKPYTSSKLAKKVHDAMPRTAPIGPAAG